MKKPNTKVRAQLLRALAEKSAMAAGVSAGDNPPHATLLTMYAEVADAGRCHITTAKRHVLAVLRGEGLAQHGGYRGSGAGYGRPKKLKETSA